MKIDTDDTKIIESDSLTEAQEIISKIKTWLEKDPADRSCVIFLNGEDYGSLNAVAGNFGLNINSFLGALEKNKYFIELMTEVMKTISENSDKQIVIPVQPNVIQS